MRRLVRELAREESKNGREKERVRRLEELQSLKQERAERRRQLKVLIQCLCICPTVRTCTSTIICIIIER